MTLASEIGGLLQQMATVYSKGDAAGCAALFTENAELHSPYAPPARGRAAIEALHVEWTADGGGEGKSFDLLNCGQSGPLAWALCRFSEGDATGDGTSLMVLEREADARWLIRMCCLHGDTEDSTA